jgi:hypothetical protein
MASAGPRPGDSFGTYRYRDASGNIRLGYWTPIPYRPNEFEVVDFDEIAAPGDVPGAHNNLDFEPEHVEVQNIPIVVLRDSSTSTIHHRSEIINEIYVVEELYFIDGALPSFRHGMGDVFRTRYENEDGVPPNKIACSCKQRTYHS